MLQKGFDLSKYSVENWRERIDEGRRRHRPAQEKRKKYSQEFKVAVVEAFIEGEGDYRELARRFGVRNSSQIRDWVRRYLEGGQDALFRNKPGRKRRPQGPETIEERCAGLELENEILKRMAASAALLSEADRSEGS